MEEFAADALLVKARSARVALGCLISAHSQFNDVINVADGTSEAPQLSYPHELKLGSGSRNAGYFRFAGTNAMSSLSIFRKRSQFSFVAPTLLPRCMTSFLLENSEEISGFRFLLY